MSRTFKKFPVTDKCLICATNDNKECFLVPIDGTGNDNISEAKPVHVECINNLELFRYNREAGVIYTRAAGDLIQILDCTED